LANDNFDTGDSTGPGKYRMNDDTYAKLLDKLYEAKFAGVSPDVRSNILNFYADPDAPYATKRDPKAWEKVQTELGQLKAAAAAPAVAQSSNTPH
jgi:hypothetical protein